MENFVPITVFLIGVVLSFSLGGLGIDRVIDGQKQLKDK
jgi:hypothetical protein